MPVFYTLRPVKTSWLPTKRKKCPFSFGTDLPDSFPHHGTLGNRAKASNLSNVSSGRSIRRVPNTWHQLIVKNVEEVPKNTYQYARLVSIMLSASQRVTVLEWTSELLGDQTWYSSPQSSTCPLAPWLVFTYSVSGALRSSSHPCQSLAVLSWVGLPVVQSSQRIWPASLFWHLALGGSLAHPRFQRFRTVTSSLFLRKALSIRALWRWGSRNTLCTCWHYIPTVSGCFRLVGRHMHDG